MVLNGRPKSVILANVLRPRNYLGVAKIVVKFRQPLRNVSRYLFGGKNYPATLSVRTPLGRLQVELYGGHDAVTATEVFCKEVYRTETAPRVVVDLGANVGISASYFLTRSENCFCFLYEPDPRNIAKIRSNLRAFSARYELSEVAVGAEDGEARFFRETTGRHGTLDSTVWFIAHGNETHSDPLSVKNNVDEIQVEVRGINSVLARVLEQHPFIDVLKIDTEGSEFQILSSIDPEHLRYIGCIVAEWFEGRVRLHRSPPSLPGFDTRLVDDMVYYTNRGARSSGGPTS